MSEKEAETIGTRKREPHRRTGARGDQQVGGRVPPRSCARNLPARGAATPNFRLAAAAASPHSLSQQHTPPHTPPHPLPASSPRPLPDHTVEVQGRTVPSVYERRCLAERFGRWSIGPSALSVCLDCACVCRALMAESRDRMV